jgi:hypothetical protein
MLRSLCEPFQVQPARIILVDVKTQILPESGRCLTLEVMALMEADASLTRGWVSALWELGYCNLTPSLDCSTGLQPLSVIYSKVGTSFLFLSRFLE